ncbi:MAG: DUF559 domain-containing protein [Solirubrobacteraceae bacterium]
MYLVGAAPPTAIAVARAAVLACGPGATLSHRSAAALWGLLSTSSGNSDVTVVARNPGHPAGIRVHRVAQMDAQELRAIRGIRVTSPARTICDVAAVEPSREVEAAITQARIRKLVRDRDLLAVIGRAPTRKGSGLVQRLLSDELEAGFTRSEAERMLRGLITAARLPAPETNTSICGYEVDVLWRGERLVIEVDGHAFHSHRIAFERDRMRDQVLVAAGYRVIRVTWRQLIDEPLAVIARIAQALRA